MHYRNGREAKVGDKVVGLDLNQNPISGMLVGVIPGSSTCNGMVISLQAPAWSVTLSNVLHVDDALPPMPQTENKP